MGSTYTPPPLKPVRLVASAAAIPVRANQRLGHQVLTFLRALLAIPFVLKHYRREVLRLTADVGWGNGSLVVGGGTIGVVIALCGFAGVTVGMESFTALNLLTMSPLTAAISGFATTRELAPIIGTLAFLFHRGPRRRDRGLRKQFDSTSKDLRDVLTQGQVVSKATDVQCAVRNAGADSAEAIVVIGQTITSLGTQGKPAPGQLSMVMRLQRAGGRWLVDKVNSPLAQQPQQ
ncbi:ABC transporter permease [Nocardia yunnanensis]|uniref:ABC transporter permease n=1 Tax=Nocardia yunnanensis TaxID=2382165 RepID=UPI001FEC0550|nr:ABC transporter permease [Nocardia yunnanensis]